MPRLTDEQKREALLIMSIGCDRATAGHYVGADAATIRTAAGEDRAFADAMARAEATAEMAHMRNIQQAAKEDKNWRASVWWLERRLPDRYGRRSPDAVAPAELKRFLLALADAIAEEVCSEEDRERLLLRLREMESPAEPIAFDDEPGTDPETDASTEAIVDPNGASETTDELPES